MIKSKKSKPLLAITAITLIYGSRLMVTGGKIK